MRKSNPRYRNTFIILAGMVVLIILMLLIRPFWVSVLTALSFSIFMRPVAVWMAEKVGNRISLKVITAGILLLAVGIISSFILIFGKEFVENFSALPDKVFSFYEKNLSEGLVIKAPSWFPVSGEVNLLDREMIERIGSIMTSASQGIIGRLTGMTKSVLMSFVNLVVFAYCSFFFISDGSRMWKGIVHSLPLTTEDGNLLNRKVSVVVQASFKSILIIGVAQAVLVGASFWVIGIPNAWGWALVVIFSSAVPGLGAFAVWFPAFLYLLFLGSFGEAVGLFIWGFFIVGWTDNILRPRIIGHDTQIPDLPIFLVVMGSIFAFGPLGVFLGPLLLACFLGLLGIFTKEQSHA